MPHRGDELRARRALGELERLVRDAEVGGVTLDPWLSELADELRDALSGPPDPTRIAALMGAEPRVALAAQSGAADAGRQVLRS